MSYQLSVTGKEVFMNIKKIISALVSVCMIGANAVCTTANAEYTRVSVHDPSVIKLDEGSYYIVGSHLCAARSYDLENWLNKNHLFQ